MTHKISNTGTYWNYIMAIISLTIMLYLLGACGILAIYADQFIHYSKENIPFYVELKDDANEAVVFSFQKKLEAAPYTKFQSVEYISKEKALDELKGDEILTEEDVLLFGENLLPNMIRFCISEESFSDYKKIVEEIKFENFVSNVFYTDAPAENLSQKVYHTEIILLLLVIFFIFVAITLIKNTLKLLLITNKESIHTIQTVGATFDFMSKPYLKQSFYNGFFSGLIAVILLWLSRWALEADLGDLGMNTTTWMIILSLGLVLIGIIISWATTKHSMNKYLKKPVSQWLL